MEKYTPRHLVATTLASYEVQQSICQSLTLRDVQSLALTCRTFQSLLSRKLTDGFPVNETLLGYFHDPVEFRQLMRSTNTVVSGFPVYELLFGQDDGSACVYRKHYCDADGFPRCEIFSSQSDRVKILEFLSSSGYRVADLPEWEIMFYPDYVRVRTFKRLSDGKVVKCYFIESVDDITSLMVRFHRFSWMSWSQATSILPYECPSTFSALWLHPVEGLPDVFCAEFQILPVRQGDDNIELFEAQRWVVPFQDVKSISTIP
jgi:hypothetical protein